jgi:hypothetical protein
VATEPAAHLWRFAHVIFAPASEVPMTHSQERIWSIVSIAAIGLGLMLALALASS